MKRSAGVGGREEMKRSEALPRLDRSRIPPHIAIIMDGNGRWARERGLPRMAGHRAGREAVRRTVEACRDLSVAYLTLFAFSTENWNRPADEVEGLMVLLQESVAEEADELARNGVRVRILGDLDELPTEITQQLRDVSARTRDNDRLVLNFALNYGGRAELVWAARRLAEDVAAGALRPDGIDDVLLSRYLYTDGLPDPDLLIRTGGEQRISNFLLWQIAYTELYFCDVYWPDFQPAHLHEAVATYQNRQRRFGGLHDD